jgi:hypothetical protein
MKISIQATVRRVIVFIIACRDCIVLRCIKGDWIARTILSTWENGTWSAKKGGKERGKDYNHSTFIDLIITGLIGLRPKSSNILVINPLIPLNLWDYFCLENVKYHERYVTIMWDKTGDHYHRGQGFFIYINEKLIIRTDRIRKIRVKLREQSPLHAFRPSLGSL